MEFPIKSGVLITVLLILPNLVWMLLPKKPAAPKASTPIALTISEWVSRIAVFIIPLFYTIELSKKFTAFAIAIMSLAIVIYYAAWIRYFIMGRTAKLFRAPFLGIPLPMAIAPVVFLILSSYILGSWPMLAASICFGVFHIWISYKSL
ncbi:MAG: hypothetical protein WBQ62_03725 [Dehalococcoidales bacterium]|jgi:hypothetical protein